MNNELANIDQLVEAMKITALTTRQHSEQMGLLLSRQTELETRIDSMESSFKTSLDKANARMQNYEDRQRIDRTQASNLRGAIHSRAAELLNIVYKDGVITDSSSLYADKYYRSGFISKIYADARKHSRLGTPYYETYTRDYEEVIDYISKWVPMVGVDGLKTYLDKRRLA